MDSDRSEVVSSSMARGGKALMDVLRELQHVTKMPLDMAQRTIGRTQGHTLRRWGSVCRPLCSSHAGIEADVEQIDEQVREQHAEGDSKEESLHERIIEVADRVEQLEPETGIGEDDLRN